MCFSTTPKSRTTVKRYYEALRKERGIPYRCDNVDCQFHKEELVWNEQEIKMILDHINGNSRDNRAENLRYICPNCDSQLPTRGGSNIGRIINESEGGFQVKHKDGKLDTLVAAKQGKISINAPDAKLKRNAKRNS